MCKIKWTWFREINVSFTNKLLRIESILDYRFISKLRGRKCYFILIMAQYQRKLLPVLKEYNVSIFLGKIWKNKRGNKEKLPFLLGISISPYLKWTEGKNENHQGCSSTGKLTSYINSRSFTAFSRSQQTKSRSSHVVTPEKNRNQSFSSQAIGS